MTTRWRCAPRVNSNPAAWPSRNAVSAVIGSELAVPRMPSVPNRCRAGDIGSESGLMGGFDRARWLPSNGYHGSRVARSRAIATYVKSDGRRTKNPLPDADGLQRLADIVHAQDRGAAQQRREPRRGRAGHAPSRHLLAGEPTDETFA